MDEKWRNHMSLMERRVENIMKAMKKAKDYEMKSIWNRKLKELFEVRGRKAFDRLENNEIKEVILATSITTAGQTTAHYLLNNIKKLDIKVSRLARGVPAGGELDYLDEATLGQALNERTLVFDRMN